MFSHGFGFQGNVLSHLFSVPFSDSKVGRDQRQVRKSDR